MSPKVNKMNYNEGEVSFICCTSIETFPDVWWFTDSAKIDTSRQQFTVDMETDESSERKTSLMVICGKEIKNDFLVFGIGENLFATHQLSQKCFSIVENCSGKYMDRVHWFV